MSAEHDIPPWYKQFWPWFLIGLLGSSVTFSLVYLALSIHYFDGTVAQDYYKEGLAINEQIAKQQHAQRLGLAATLRADPRTGDIVVDLAGERRPEQLTLKLIFPTESQRDRTLTLEHVHDGRYVTMIDEPLRYRWYLHLQPSPGEAAEWRLTGEAHFPSEDEIALVPGI
ncbi:FixH family protein [Halomonas maura]|uniref:FixH family protein n=1 Tax=Halomonas maura TaxID=117606 RepID=UPI0025B4386F|nr:FixH family protein [Halomonas maura]MDN3557332.1 FixH family protein [Halomonas maura]